MKCCTILNLDLAGPPQIGGTMEHWKVFEWNDVLESKKDLSDKGCQGDYVFHWQGIGNARKKCLVVSISVPQLHMGL